MTGRFVCPCCGYADLRQPPYANLKALADLENLNPPYSRHFGAPTYEVCNCCGFEFGNDDEPGTAAPVSFHQHLAEWIKDGSLWFDPKAKPSNWSLEEQL